MFEGQLMPHPAVVHFPLALLPLALVVEVAGLLWGIRAGWIRAGWLRHVAVLLLVLGVLAGTVAFLTGRVASNAAGDVSADDGSGDLTIVSLTASPSAGHGH